MSRLTVVQACEQLQAKGIKASCHKRMWSADRAVGKHSRLRKPGKLRETWQLDIEYVNGTSEKWLSGYSPSRLTDFVNHVLACYQRRGGK